MKYFLFINNKIQKVIYKIFEKKFLSICKNKYTTFLNFIFIILQKLFSNVQFSILILNNI